MKSHASLPGLWEILCLGIGLALALSACSRPDAPAADRVSVFMR